MDKDVIVEFTKLMAVVMVKIVALVAAVFAVVFGLTFFGFTPEQSVLFGTTGFLWALITFFTVEVTWNRAKTRIEYKRKYGEDL